MDLGERDARNRIVALERRSRIVRGPTLGDGVNAIFGFGQSNSEGPHAWPPLQRSNVGGALMLGDDVHPAAGAAGAYVPLGGAILKPLVGQAIALDTFAAGSTTIPADTVITDFAEVPAAAPIKGETPELAAVNLLAALTGRTMLAANGAKRGASINALLNTYFPRYPAFLEALAEAAETFNVPAIVFLQGETEAMGGNGSEGPAVYNTRPLYLGALRQMQRALSEVSPRPPWFLTWVPGGLATADFDYASTPARDLFVQMAIQEHADRLAVIPGTYYAHHHDGHHLDGPGTRAVGLKTGQVLDRLLNQRLAWEPCRVLGVETDGVETLVHVLVPEPPLQVKPVPRETGPVLHDSLGFFGVDDTGPIAMASIDLAAPSIVRIEWARTPEAGAVLYYAGKRGYGPDHDGAGNICDSDPFDPRSFLSLSAHGRGSYGSGPYGRAGPIDMANWLLPFCLPL